jgi:hypothetical protein
MCYTPTDGSWLNLAESFFWILDRRVYDGTDHFTMKELEVAIEAGLHAWNAHPTPGAANVGGVAIVDTLVSPSDMAQLHVP